MASKLKKQSLADKINSLITTTPATFNSDDDDADDTKATVVDHYDESDDSDNNFRVSKIRRQNVDSLDQVDKRYKGKKISRKDVYDTYSGTTLQDASESEENDKLDTISEQSDIHMYDSDERESINNNDSYAEDDESNDNMKSDEDDESNDNMKSEEDDEESDDSYEEMSYDSEESGEDTKSDTEEEVSNNVSDLSQENNIQTITHTNTRAEIDKGNCVRNQLQLWESLLEMRIKLQKCLISSNQMPQYDVYKHFKADVEYSKAVAETQEKLKVLLNNMLQLQCILLKQYPETKHLSANTKKRKAEEYTTTKQTSIENSMDEEILSDTEDENENKNERMDEDKHEDDENTYKKKLKLENYESILNNNHNSYVDYRNTVIQKWYDKTKIASGKINKGIRETTLKQIEFALSDKSKLYKRSQLMRSEYKILGKIEATDDGEDRKVQEYNSEIYDDDDFYHQLLRDLIENKSSDITDPIQLSKQWVQLQNMRSKMKRKIDTRATKGRKIRYTVHNKLVNFMAPITINDVWTDHAKDDLYNSLFGKIKSGTGNPVP